MRGRFKHKGLQGLVAGPFRNRLYAPSEPGAARFGVLRNWTFFSRATVAGARPTQYPPTVPRQTPANRA